MADAPEAELLPYAVTTFDRVNGILRGAVTSSKSTVIEIINTLTETLEGPDFFNRPLERKIYSEILHGGRCFYPVFAPPVWGSLKVWDDSSKTFVDGTELVNGTDYELDFPGVPTYQKPNRPSRIRKLYGDFSCGSGNIKFLYEGGLINPNNRPNDISGDCAMQVAHWFQNTERIGQTQVTIPNVGSIFMRDPSKMLPGMQRLFNKYKIHRYS